MCVHIKNREESFWPVRKWLIIEGPQNGTFSCKNELDISPSVFNIDIKSLGKDLLFNYIVD